MIVYLNLLLSIVVLIVTYHFVLAFVPLMGTILFEVKKNKHWFKPFLIKFHFGRKMQYNVSFNDDCKYDLKNSSDQLDGNKLFGFSLDWSHHHKNSIRVVWRYLIEQDSIQLGLSYYNKGKRTMVYSEQLILMNKVDSDEIKLKISDNALQTHTAKLVINGDIAAMLYLDRKHTFVGYKLWPYFGGNRKVPHDMLIKFKSLK